MKRPKAANNDTPTCSFRFMHQTWQRVALACRKGGFTTFADSIEKHIEGVRKTDLVEIEVPIHACVKIAQACATHDVSTGIAFATACSSHLVEKVTVKPVPSDAMTEALANAREELDLMEQPNDKT